MTGHLTWIEAKLLAREPLTLLVGVLFPLVLLALLGASFGNEPDPDFGGVGGTDFYVAVYSTATIAVMGLLGVPTHVATYRQDGILKRFRASRIRPSAFMGSQLLITAAIVAIGSALAIGVGFVTADLTVPDSPIGVVVGMGAGVLAFTGVGLALGTLLPTARAAQGLGLLLFFGLFFIAGGGPPPSLLPDAMNRVVEVTPMGLVVSAVASPWHGHGADVAAILSLLVYAIVGGVIARIRLRHE